MPADALWIPADYADSRARVRAALERLQARWPSAARHETPLPDHPDLTIDWLEAPARERTERLLMVTTGLHGIEGFVGAGVIDHLLGAFTERLDPATTDLLIVHAINPWGMAHRRRGNQANVDLNRNFILDGRGFDPAFNPDYARLDRLLNPRRPAGPPGREQARFALRLLGGVLRVGPARLRAASLLGQYARPDGIYYGGAAHQPETEALLDLFRHALRRAGHVLLIDVHTGYGPRQALTLVNSPLELRSPAACAAAFGHAPVVAAAPRGLFSMRGDMVDAFYSLARRQARGHRVYGVTFEYGTLGDSTLDGARSLFTLVYANQVHQHGATHPAAENAAAAGLVALFVPADPVWRSAARAGAQRALEGILGAEGFLAR